MRPGTLGVLLAAGCPQRPESLMAPVAGPAGVFWVDRFEHPNHLGATPAAALDFSAAAAGCAGQGKRLCTLAEWQRACAGSSAASPLRADACVVGGAAPGPLQSGAWPSCVSPDGVFDLLGNVAEWVEGPGGAGLRVGGAVDSPPGAVACSAPGIAGPGVAGARCCAGAPP
jgi:hypothetical protein